MSKSIDKQYQRGLITDDERYEKVVQIWKDTTQAVSDRMAEVTRPDRRGDDDDQLGCPR